jgi:hypothetical protein
MEHNVMCGRHISNLVGACYSCCQIHEMRRYRKKPNALRLKAEERLRFEW